MTTDHEACVEAMARTIKRAQFASLELEHELTPKMLEYVMGTEYEDMARAALNAADASDDLTTAYMLGHSRGKDARVERAAKAVHKWNWSHVDYPTTWESDSEEGRQYCLDVSRIALQAADATDDLTTAYMLGPRAVAAANSDRAVGEGEGDE